VDFWVGGTVPERARGADLTSIADRYGRRFGFLWLWLVLVGVSGARAFGLEGCISRANWLVLWYRGSPVC
jgi:uncharacterized membrane protein YedE/YeeE